LSLTELGTNGRCNCTPIGATANSWNQCSYDTCASDDDCAGKVCHCREDPAHVYWGTQTFCYRHGDCKTDSDCGPGGYCSPSPAPGCGAGATYSSWYGYFCHTPGDDCVDDGDCSGQEAYCAYDETKQRWICAMGTCVDS